jgi:hypothetical protein
MALRARQEAGLDVEGEKPLLVARSVDVLSSALFQELPRERQPEVGVVDRLGSPCQVEGILVVGAWERVQREATIP